MADEQTPGTPPQPAPERPPPRHVFRWDLDKTYLKTDFHSLRGLVRSALEGAEAKQAIPGAAALLRELRKLDGARVCFISGSPQQMRKVLARKLELDGVEYDEFVLKHNLRNLLKGRFRALKEQVGYKLPALLSGRGGCLASTRETCFGDDAEADAFVYSLYADLLSGRVSRETLEGVLDKARVYDDDATRTLTLADELEPTAGPVVDRIFIHLDRHSPTARFEPYGRRLVPIYNYAQVGLVLVEDGLLSLAAMVRVAAEMTDKFEYAPMALRNSVEDLLRRGRLTDETVRRFAVACRESVGDAATPITDLARRLEELKVHVPNFLPDPPPMDYLAAFEDGTRRA